jgi:Rieske Fe-S protein
MEKGNNKKSRREFFRLFFFGSLTAWLGAISYMVFRFLSPIKSMQRKLPPFVDIAKNIEDMPENSSFMFPFGNRPGILIKKDSGDMVAFFATCTHLNCTVQFHPVSKQIVCNCHDGIFDLDGKNIAGPPKDPLTPMIIRVFSKKKIRFFRPKK